MPFSTALSTIFCRYFHPDGSSGLVNCIPLALPRLSCIRFSALAGPYISQSPYARVNHRLHSFIVSLISSNSFPSSGIFSCLRPERFPEVSRHPSKGLWMLFWNLHSAGPAPLWASLFLSLFFPLIPGVALFICKNKRFRKLV